jgi:hypothetical protein
MSRQYGGCSSAQHLPFGVGELVPPVVVAAVHVGLALGEEGDQRRGFGRQTLPGAAGQLLERKDLDAAIHDPPYTGHVAVDEHGRQHVALRRTMTFRPPSGRTRPWSA